MARLLTLRLRHDARGARVTAGGERQVDPSTRPCGCCEEFAAWPLRNQRTKHIAEARLWLNDDEVHVLGSLFCLAHHLARPRAVVSAHVKHVSRRIRTRGQQSPQEICFRRPILAGLALRLRCSHADRGGELWCLEQQNHPCKMWKQQNDRTRRLKHEMIFSAVVGTVWRTERLAVITGP